MVADEEHDRALFTRAPRRALWCLGQGFRQFEQGFSQGHRTRGGEDHGRKRSHPAIGCVIAVGDAENRPWPGPAFRSCCGFIQTLPSMKPLYALSISALIPFGSVGPTMTRADMPVPGDQFLIDYGPYVALRRFQHDLGLQHLVRRQLETIQFVDPAGTPMAASFPGATVAPVPGQQLHLFPDLTERTCSC